MGRRVLIVLALAPFGCHDWSSFDRVPASDREEVTGAPAPAQPAPSGSTPAPSTSTDPIVFASPGGEHPTLLAADGEGIAFVTREGSVMACPHTGCDSIGRLASTQHDVRSIAVSGAWAAWTARGDNAVRRTTRTPGGAVDQVFEDDGLLMVGVTTSKLYFSTEADFAFGAPALRGCSPGVDCDFSKRDVANGVVTDLRIDGSDVFWIEDQNLFSCPVAACEADTDKKATLVNGVKEGAGIATDFANVYFLGPEGGGELRALPRAGGSVRTIASGVGGDARFAVTKRWVWIASASARTFSRVAIEGGAVTVVAHDLAEPIAIASGGDAVYVACVGDGRILRWKAEP